MYKAKLIDGKIFLCDEKGNKVPKQIENSLSQNLDQSDAKIAEMTVTLWVKLDDN